MDYNISLKKHHWKGIAMKFKVLVRKSTKKERIHFLVGIAIVIAICLVLKGVVR